MSLPVGKIAVTNLILIVVLLVIGTLLAISVDRTFGENIISTCIGIVFGSAATTVVVARNMPTPPDKGP